MTGKSMIIIGAGIAGLSTGVYAQMNGYNAHILELHSIPGGLCTAWKRSGYLFDGCIHDLAGAGPTSSLHHLWEELCPDVIPTMVYHEATVQVESRDGRKFVVYTDVDRLEAHMKELSPVDPPVIEEYCNGIRFFAKHELYELQETAPEKMLRWLPRLPQLMRWRMTMEQFAQRFQDPFLREAFPTIQYNFAGCPMLVHLAFMGCQQRKTMGWPKGGSLVFAQSIARRFVALGGQITYRARVTKILVENGAAVGVRLEDGRELRADIIVSAADGYSTHHKMLDGQYMNDFLRSYYAGAPDGNAMNLLVSLGVRNPMSGLPRALHFPLTEPVEIAGMTLHDMVVEIFNFDPSIVPAGGAVLKIALTSSYSYWKALSENREQYEAEKEHLAQTIIDLLEKRFPGIHEQIEAVDVATPVTIERYTANYRGLQVWFPNKGMGRMLLKGISPTLPGLKNFYMVGQWSDGMLGINSVAVGAWKLVRKLCKQDGKQFTTIRGRAAYEAAGALLRNTH